MKDKKDNGRFRITSSQRESWGDADGDDHDDDDVVDEVNDDRVNDVDVDDDDDVVDEIDDDGVNDVADHDDDGKERVSPSLLLTSSRERGINFVHIMN